MNIGIQDAVSLAGALDEVLRGGDERVLDKWAAERRESAEGVVMMTDRLTQMATMKSPTQRAMRNILLSAAGHVSPIRSAIARRLAGVE
jgi:2-polyprenyl-6-methoxyphenol hydroxylase-like FAD-dependent oxidoreductase